MLFSGTVSTVKCEACDYEHHLVRSTSILLYIALAAMGTAFIMPLLRRYLGNLHWYQFLCVFICELVVLVGAMCVLDRMVMILDGQAEYSPGPGKAAWAGG